MRPRRAAVWVTALNAVRAAVLETIATLAPPGRNFVFTHAVSTDGGHPGDLMVAGRWISWPIFAELARRLARSSCGCAVRPTSWRNASRRRSAPTA